MGNVLVPQPWGDKNTSSRFMQLKPEISAGLMGHSRGISEKLLQQGLLGEIVLIALKPFL